MSGFVHEFEWSGTSSDPNDEQFGDVIERCSMGSRTQSDDVVEPTTLDEADRYDAVLVGEPYDGAVIGTKGAREGPGAIRESLAALKTRLLDGFAVGNVGDLGDVAALRDADEDTPVSEVQERVRDVAERVHAADAFPVFLGGDNSLSYANAAPLLDDGSLGCINFDAHLDVREVRDDATSGTPYRQLFEAGLDAYACVGARDFETSSSYVDYVRERGGLIVTAAEATNPPEPFEESNVLMNRIKRAMGNVDRVYVSVDMDVLDAAAAPGVSAPTPGGLSTLDLFRLVRTVVSDLNVVGFEIVETAPRLDPSDRTVNAASRMVAHALAGAKEDYLLGGDEK